MATVPWRRESLRLAVESLRPQVDALRVYLNGGERPDFLGPGECVHAEDADGDLGAMGKLWFVDREPADVYLSCDDDIVYPPGYADMMAREVLARDGRCVVTLHGFRWRDPSAPDYKLSDAKVCRHHYRRRATVAPQEIHVPGTGVAAFAPSALRPTVDREHRNLVDIHMGIEAEKRGLPVVAVSHPAHWLSATASRNDPRCLWKQRRNGSRGDEGTEYARTAVWRRFDDPGGAPEPGGRTNPQPIKKKVRRRRWRLVSVSAHKRRAT